MPMNDFETSDFSRRGAADEKNDRIRDLLRRNRALDTENFHLKEENRFLRRRLKEMEER